MSKYNVTEDTRNGFSFFHIEREGQQSRFGGTYGRSNTDTRLSEYVGRKLRAFLLEYLVGNTTEAELMTEAKDFCSAVKIVAERNVAILNEIPNGRTGDTMSCKEILHEIQRLEGPYSLYAMIENHKCRGWAIGTNVNDVSVELIAMKDYTVKLEASINAYHELDGRLLDESRSTADHPVYLDGMRVCATIRGRFNDLTLFPLLVARLALMKGEPLATLAKRSLMIKP